MDAAKLIATLRKCVYAITAAQLDPKSTRIPAYIVARRELQDAFERLPYATKEKLPTIRDLPAIAGAMYGTLHIMTEPGHLLCAGAAAWPGEVHKLNARALAELDALPEIRRRRTPPREIVPLTPEQLEAYELVGRHDGNYTEAAREAGKTRAAITKLYQKAMAKLAAVGVKRPKTQTLPTDFRGQIDVADPTGPAPPKGRATKRRATP